MKHASDFRKIARDALRGKWAISVLTGFLALLMSAGIVTSSGDLSQSMNIDSSSPLFEIPQVGEYMILLRSILTTILPFLALWMIITFFICGAAKLGYAIFNLRLVDHKEIAVSDLFSQFYRFWCGFRMNFLLELFTLLWSLLFLIPGIIKQYSYAMTPYILAEHPGMSAKESITKSRRIMNGNKWRLFCLHFSFIGWDLLCIAPMLIALLVSLPGIALINNFLTAILWITLCIAPSFICFLFLIPYQEATNAAFYREITRTPSPAPETPGALES